jgi:iron complex outermembrane recepter protein
MNGFARRCLAAWCLVTLPALAHSQNDDRQQPASGATLDKVTVTGARIPGVISDVPTAVSILDSAELQDQFSISTNVLKALDVRVPGLTVSTGGRDQCRTNIRGRRPSFQINGVPANQDLRPSNCNSAFQVSPFALEQIEVVRGATALFGAGAPGGIVNLITRRASSPELEVDMVAQTGANTGKTSDTFATDLYVGAGQDLGAFDYYLGVGHQDYDAARDPNDEFVPTTEFRSLSVNGAGGLELSDTLRLRFTGTWYEEDPGQEYNVDGAEVDAGVPFPRVIAVENNPFRDQSSDRQSTLAVSLEADDLLGHQLAASVFYQEQEFRQRANFQDSNGGNPDFFNDNRENSTTGLRLTLARDYYLGQTPLGLEYGLDYQRNRLLRVLLDTDDPSQVVGLIAPEVILDTTGLFVQGDLRIDRWNFTGGIRQEFYSGEIGDDYAGLGLPGEGTPGDFDDADLVLFNAALIYDLTSRFQLYTSFNQGAEVTQLGRAARRATNPGLISPEPAKSDQYEIGGRGGVGPLEVSFATFYSESDAASLIQPDPSCAGESFCPLIPLRVPQRVWGVEGTLAWQLDPALEIGSVFTWQEGEIRNEDLGGYVPFGADTISPTRLTGYGQWRPLERLTLGAQATYIWETSFFSPTEQEFGFIDTDSVFVADVSGSYEIGPGAITVGISNVLDKRYENVTLAAAGFLPTLAEGRRLTVGYIARF